MEHAHRHQIQDGQLELSGSSSSSSNSALTPSTYGAASSSTHGWTQNFNLNVNSRFCSNSDSIVHNSGHKSDSLASSFRSSTPKHLRPYWNGNPLSFTNNSTHDELLSYSRIKDEVSDSFPKFSDMLSSSALRFDSSHGLPFFKNEQNINAEQSEKLLFKTISSAPSYEHHFPAGGGWVFSSTQNSSTFGPEMLPSSDAGCFNQIYPSTYVSHMNVPSISSLPPPFDMNEEAMDLFHSTRFSGTIGQPCPRSESRCSYNSGHSSIGDLDQLQSSPKSSSSLSKISLPLSDEIATESKRFRSCVTGSSLTTTSKKSRAESRSSAPPFKVRKEKLGDKVAALQQLVAPFGKTDTASVLMEAIGYIKFLQNQVETLSVPYMKSSRSKSNGSTRERFDGDDEMDDRARALKGRGLCLVPLSSMSYVAALDGGISGGSVWTPPGVGGGT